MRISQSVPALLPAALAIGMFGMVAPAQASTRPAVVVNGTCSRGSLSNLQVQREDNGTLSIDFGVDMSAHRRGVKWVVKVLDNTSIVYRGNVVTIADGSFSISKAIAPKTGTNHIVATARNSATGETCKIRALA
jgi:hypothetical protein